MNEREKIVRSKLEAVQEEIPWNVSFAGVTIYIWLTQIPEVIGGVIDNAVSQGELDWKRVGAILLASSFLYATYDVARNNIADKNKLRDMHTKEAYILSL